MASRAKDPVSGADSSRRRLSREERLRQLLDVSWQLIRAEGTDTLTLGRLAEAAGVTKPVVYDHFGTRNGLLVALYRDFDVRQTVVFDGAVAASQPLLNDRARVIASSYIDCVLTQGREIPDVLAALNGSPELAVVKREYQHAFIEKCQKVLAPFAGSRSALLAGLWATLGAAEALSHAAVVDEIDEEEARDALKETLLAMVERSKQARPGPT